MTGKKKKGGTNGWGRKLFTVYGSTWGKRVEKWAPQNKKTKGAWRWGIRWFTGKKMCREMSARQGGAQKKKNCFCVGKSIGDATFSRRVIPQMVMEKKLRIWVHRQGELSVV